ncbi:hypothetical protein LOTGIDRAFT_160186 [Lottia gigantea]|uniref:Uncharacterized protein n=1 Tax=Lottia gigantea TaxID=225164 RepID=V4AR73_LOTGI|nr:hypothetical protein LOTGIDRAFT_160186 [Lottia gigantea]ESO96196.1 hypothetical protein LOTGIDRAFT_160186 [Lottia gigantea]
MADTLENIHYNANLEHQIKKILNATDDEFIYRDFIDGKISKKFKSSKKKSKKEDAFDMCGWIPHGAVTLRKIERSNTDSARDLNRELISWKEQCGINPSDRHYFHFKHYKDTKKYIEQYRRECVCLRNTVIPKNNECLDIKRIRKVNKNKHLRTTTTSSPTRNGESKPATFSYTNRGASLLTKLSDTVYNNDYNADEGKHMDTQTNKQVAQNTPPENRILSPVKGINSPRTIDKLKASVQYLEKCDTSINESEYSDASEQSDDNAEIAMPMLCLSDSNEGSTNVTSKEDAALATFSPQNDHLDNELSDSYSDPISDSSCAKDSPKPDLSVSTRPENGFHKPFYPDTRFGDKKIITSPEFPVVKSVPSLPISEVNNSGEKVWKPTTRKSPLNRMNELEKERQVGINHPFKSKNPFRDVNSQSRHAENRFVSVSENINPPGKIRPVLIQSQTNTSQFPQPMCYSFKADSAKIPERFEGQRKIFPQKSSSASDVFQVKNDFSDISRSPSTPKSIRRESSYRQKLYFPTEEFKSPRLEYTVKKDTHAYAETPISMPSIYMYKHGLRVVVNKDITVQSDNTSNQLPALNVKPSTDNTTSSKKQFLQISEYTPTMDGKHHTSLPAVDYDSDDQPTSDAAQETQARKVLPRKLKAQKDKFASYNISDKKMKQFVEMNNCEQNSTKKKLLDDSQGGPSIANGMWFDSNGRAYVSLAARYEPIKK